MTVVSVVVAGPDLPMVEGGYKMAATAGTLYAKGLKTGTTYAIDVYVPDAVADVLRFDSGAGAGSDRAPRNETNRRLEQRRCAPTV